MSSTQDPSRPHAIAVAWDGARIARAVAWIASATTRIYPATAATTRCHSSTTSAWLMCSNRSTRCCPQREGTRARSCEHETVSLQELFVPSVSPLAMLFRGSVVYLSLFIMLRALMKRESSEFGVTDLLVLVLLADAAQNAMSGGYRSITDGLV